MPQSFVCNIGNMLDRMTGGLYRSRTSRRAGKVAKVFTELRREVL